MIREWEPEEKEIAPTYRKFSGTLEILRGNKSSSSDEISNKLIKAGGQELKNRLYKLITKILKEGGCQQNGD